MNTEKTSKVATFLSKEIDNSKYTQKELADFCGFKTANMITMLKQGLTKLSVKKVAPLAKALKIDSVKLFMMVLLERDKEEYLSVVDILGQPIFRVERKLLKMINEIKPYSEMESEEDYVENIKSLINR